MLIRGRHGFSDALSGVVDITMTSASSPESTGALGLDYGRFEVMGGAEYYWAPTSYATFRAGLVNYKDNRQVGVDTSQFLMRLRITQAF